jgi:uncharacterized membrane protein
MRTPASIAGHPIHPMVVPIAIGGFLLSFVFDIVCLATGTMDPWAVVAFYTMIGGIVGALIAAIFGFTDLISLPKGYTRNVGLTHMGINLTIVVLYIINAWMRHANPEALKGPMVLSLIAIALLLVSGWLGGKMVYEAGVGVSGGEAPAATTRPGRQVEV